jgi:hypothetical protein
LLVSHSTNTRASGVAFQEVTMKLRSSLLSAIFFGSVVGAGACTVSTTPGVVDVVCSNDNVACNVDAECCSNLCASDGFCGAPTSSCALDNDACGSDGDCCSGVCASDGYCGLP